MMMTIGSLFTGIGGIDLGLERAGLGPVIYQCEIDPFCRAVLAKHWPHATRFTDVSSKRVWPYVDLVCGGFPCTDVSSAGKREGLQGQHSSLWWYFASVIDQARPRIVLIENVASGKGRWLPTVRRHLHVLGYDSTAYALSAADCGAPHRRNRIFVVAYAHGKRGDARTRGKGSERAGRPVVGGVATDANRVWEPQSRGGEPDERGRPRDGAEGDYADALRARREGAGADAYEGRARPASVPRWASEPGVVPLVHGLSGGLAGRGRRARIRALGNSCTPAQAEVIGRLTMDSLVRRDGTVKA